MRFNRGPLWRRARGSVGPVALWWRLGTEWQLRILIEHLDWRGVGKLIGRKMIYHWLLVLELGTVLLCHLLLGLHMDLLLEEVGVAQALLLLMCLLM